MADAVEQIVSNQSCLEQGIVCPEIMGSNAGSGKVIFDFIDYLLYYRSLVILAPNMI
jgi:hypothetical protein